MRLTIVRGLKQVKRACVDRPAVQSRLTRLRHFGIRNISRLCGPEIALRPIILGYHSIGDGLSEISIPTGRFLRDIKWLIRNDFRILTLRAWREMITTRGAAPPRSVVLTFDDGFRGVLRDAAPILQELGAAATLFVVTDYVGKTNTYDRPLGVPELPMLTWKELERLQGMGWDIQSHGRRHLPMAQLSPDVLDDELAGSKAVLEERLGGLVDFFCYPYGCFDETTVEAVRRAGYAGAVTCRPGPLPDQASGDWYRLSRSLVDGLATRGDFASRMTRGFSRLSGFVSWMRHQTGQHAACMFDELQQLREAQADLYSQRVSP